MATVSSNYIIWLNAFPGAGKLTIARELVQLLGSDQALLIDNHQLIDAVTLPRDHPQYQDERRNQRYAAFTRHLYDDAAKPVRVVIFTDFQSDNELGTSVSAEYRVAAERSKRKFLPVYVTCDREENIRRVSAADRQASGKGKLLDQEFLVHLMENYNLFRWPGVGIEIDSTTMLPKEAAQAILDELYSRDTET
jgi:adenylylsulfate kinase-like enzyme